MGTGTGSTPRITDIASRSGSGSAFAFSISSSVISSCLRFFVISFLLTVLQSFRNARRTRQRSVRPWSSTVLPLPRLPRRTERVATVLRLEARETDEDSPTFAEIAALTSPAKSTPSAFRRIRRWMTLRICMTMFSPHLSPAKHLWSPGSLTRLPLFVGDTPVLYDSRGGGRREPRLPRSVVRPSRVDGPPDRERAAWHEPARRRGPP